MEATDEAAVKGDRLLITAKFSHDGHYLSEMDEEYVTLSDQVSFSDGICANFGEVLSGAMEGDTRTVQVTISDGSDDESMRGKVVDAEIKVVEVLHRSFGTDQELLGRTGRFRKSEESTPVCA